MGLEGAKELDLAAIDFSNQEEIQAAAKAIATQMSEDLEATQADEVLDFLSRVLVEHQNGVELVAEVLFSNHCEFLETPCEKYNSLCRSLAHAILQRAEIPINPLHWFELAESIMEFETDSDMELGEKLLEVLLKEYPYFYSGWLLYCQINEHLLDELQGHCSYSAYIKCAEMDRKVSEEPLEPIVEGNALIIDSLYNRDDVPFEFIQLAAIDEISSNTMDALMQLLASLQTVEKKDKHVYLDVLANIERILTKILCEETMVEIDRNELLATLRAAKIQYLNIATESFEDNSVPEYWRETVIDAEPDEPQEIEAIKKIFWNILQIPEA
ncbi:hypothetical protein KKC94_02345 [Patescibacteria group bacterium]|nr:hypothetical protein [Patescibacteria group bacterium]